MLFLPRVWASFGSKWSFKMKSPDSAFKRKKILPFAKIWMNLEDTMINEIQQSQKKKKKMKSPGYKLGALFKLHVDVPKHTCQYIHLITTCLCPILKVFCKQKAFLR